MSNLDRLVKSIGEKFASGNSTPVERAMVTRDELDALFAAAFAHGWHASARWAHRDDLHLDVDSKAYAKERTAAQDAILSGISGFAREQGPVRTIALPGPAKPELCAPISAEWMAQRTGYLEGWNACLAKVKELNP